MANEEHVKRLKEDVEGWNRWREADVSAEEKRNASLRRMFRTLNDSDPVLQRLRTVDLSGADLVNVKLWRADLRNANLTGAKLSNADVDVAKFDGANLREADLTWARLQDTSFTGADLTGAVFGGTIFARVGLRDTIGLETCKHEIASSVDFRTLAESSVLPLSFLRGVGLPENLISYLPSLLNQSFEFYSCFISFSTSDDRFANRVHADLQSSGVRCWFAPHDMPIGHKILNTIDQAIRLHDKVLLILSEHSIKSDWVEDEVTKAFEEERKRGNTILFPIRLDDAVMDTNEPWAAKLRARHIGDFRRWKEHDEYQKSFTRVLRDLTVKKD